MSDKSRYISIYIGWIQHQFCLSILFVSGCELTQEKSIIICHGKFNLAFAGKRKLAVQNLSETREWEREREREVFEKKERKRNGIVLYKKKYKDTRSCLDFITVTRVR